MNASTSFHPQAHRYLQALDLYERLSRKLKNAIGDRWYRLYTLAVLAWARVERRTWWKDA